MNKKQQNLLIIFVVLICLGIIFLIVWISKFLTEQIKSFPTMCAATSIGAHLISELKEGNSHLEEIFSSADEEWRFLTLSEYDKTIMVLDNTAHDGLEARKERPLLDPWGNRFVIGYRKSTSEKYELVVVSNGPDGVCGTTDDHLFDLHGSSEEAEKRRESIFDSLRTSLKE